MLTLRKKFLILITPLVCGLLLLIVLAFGYQEGVNEDLQHAQSAFENTLHAERLAQSVLRQGIKYLDVAIGEDEDDLVELKHAQKESRRLIDHLGMNDGTTDAVSFIVHLREQYDSFEELGQTMLDMSCARRRQQCSEHAKEKYLPAFRQLTMLIDGIVQLGTRRTHSHFLVSQNPVTRALSVATHEEQVSAIIDQSFTSERFIRKTLELVSAHKLAVYLQNTADLTGLRRQRDEVFAQWDALQAQSGLVRPDVVASVHAMHVAFNQLDDQLHVHVSGGNLQAAADMLEEQAERLLDEHVEHRHAQQAERLEDHIHSGVAAMRHANRRAQAIVMILSLLVLEIAFGLPWLLSRWIVEPIVHMKDVTEKIGDGDLEQRLPVASGDEIGALAVAFNNMVERTQCDAEALRRALAEKDAIYAQLMQIQKLNAVGELASGVAHEFNNLLLVIASSIEQARRNPAKDHRALDLISKASNDARHVTQSLLTFSRDMRSDSKKILELSDVVRESCSLIMGVLPKMISWDVETAASGTRIVGDRVLLQQAIVNLVLNSRDAMPDGGQLCVRAFPGAALPRDKVPQWGDCEWVCLEVSDGGRGMSDDVISRVFEPFFTTKSRTSGTGLGLAIVHGIVKDHQGCVVIDSIEHRGTVVRVFLPSANRVGKHLPVTAEDQVCVES